MKSPNAKGKYHEGIEHRSKNSVTGDKLHFAA